MKKLVKWAAICAILVFVAVPLVVMVAVRGLVR